MRWSRGPVTVERVGDALWIEAEGGGLLVDVPDGTAAALGDRSRRLRSVLLLSGRLERVSGLMPLFARLGRASDVPMVLRFPLSDTRGATLAEAWERSWGDWPLTLDAVAPGERFDIGPFAVRSVALRHPRSGDPPMGVQLELEDTRVSIVPRCVRDGAAAYICRNADLVVAELGGGGLSATDAVALAGAAELWIEPGVTDQ